MKIGVIDYGLGNLPSLVFALRRAGVTPELVESPDDFSEVFSALVLPGVGHFGTGMRNLVQRGYVAPLRAWVASCRPLLGICVGLQVMLESSEEEPGVPGLGLIPGRVRRVEAPKVPHMGWNTLTVSDRARVVSAVDQDDMVYFVHSYYADPDPGSIAAYTTYAKRFCSGVEAGSITGVQFHPEKSGRPGAALLRRFCELAG